LAAGTDTRPRGLIDIEDFETLQAALADRGGQGINFEEFKLLFKDGEPGFLVPLIEALTGTTVHIKRRPPPPAQAQSVPTEQLGSRPTLANKFKSSGGEKSQEMTRHEEELKELKAMKYISTSEMDGYLRTFGILSDETKTISQTGLAQRAEQIFGFRCIKLTQRFHELVDQDGSGRLGVSEWVRTRERLANASWNMKMEFAFSLYDFDGDGLISVDDAVEIRRELQRLADLKRCKIEELQAPLCVEMRWLYDFVLEESWLNSYPGLELGTFRQMTPNPVIFSALQENLDVLGKSKGPGLTKKMTGLGRK